MLKFFRYPGILVCSVIIALTAGCIFDPVLEETLTPVATFTSTQTPTTTPPPTATSTPTSTPTATNTPTATDTPTSTPTITPTFTPSLTPTVTPRPVCENLFSPRIPLSEFSTDVRAEITYPAHCADDVGRPPENVVMAGTYSNLDLQKQTLWLLVYPPANLYYPQGETGHINGKDGPCYVRPTEMGAGRWRVPIALGGDEPLQFDLVLIVTDKDGAADKGFKKRLVEACENNDYPGFRREELLEFGGIIEVDAITVHTR